MAEGVGPGVQPPDQVMDLSRRLAPVNDAVFPGQPWGQGRLFVVLLLLDSAARRQVIDAFYQRFGAKHGQRLLEHLAGVVRPDRHTRAS